jgi:hypothetical protein
MQIAIQLQYRENYGAHSWDGKGECPQFWKSKGGEEVLVTGLPVMAYTESDLRKIVDVICEKFDLVYSSDYSEQYVIYWSIKDDDYIPWEEAQQIEYGGSITYPTKRIEWCQVEGFISECGVV